MKLKAYRALAIGDRVYHVRHDATYEVVELWTNPVFRQVRANELCGALIHIDRKELAEAAK